MNSPELSASNRQPTRGWVIVALLLTAATACSFLLDRYVSLTSQAMIYVLAVVIASYKLRLDRVGRLRRGGGHRIELLFCAAALDP